MAAPYYPSQEAESERPWMGIALLLSVPLLSLILIRMLWSGSGMWYLLAGIVFLGAAAALFWARSRDQYGPTTLADEPNRLPLALMGIGLVFVVLLLLPNFSGGNSSAVPAQRAGNQPSQSSSSVRANVTAPTAVRVQPTAASSVTNNSSSQVALHPAADGSTGTSSSNTSSTNSADTSSTNTGQPPAGSQTYVVKDGDTLSDVAAQFGVSVDAIVTANSIDDPANIQIGDELTIPPASADSSASDSTAADATPAQ